VEVAAIRPVTVLPSIASGPTASGPGGSPAATPVSNAGTPAPASSDRPATAQAGKALPPPSAAPSTPGDELASSVRWVQSQPLSGWLVQHGIDSDVGRLLDLRRSFPRLSESRVLALLRADGRLYYALVSGPFDSAGDARSYIKDGADMPSLPWVRSIASLARELDDRRRSLPGAAAPN
jgi:septal ring-binding cell division protein DamX